MFSTFVPLRPVFFSYLDAKRKGGIARFVNHSCDPTCRLEQWTAMGQPRCAVFSLRGMEAGEVRHRGISHGLRV